MAAAEARAAWQRTANRFFVQEDAKRAPKLACPSPAYPLFKCAEEGPTNTTDEHEKLNLGFMPLNRNSSYSDLPPESRWWLQIQPHYISQKGFTNEKVNAVMENCETKNENDFSICVDDNTEIAESYELLELDSIGSSASKKVDYLSFSGSRRSEPWWRVADEDDLISLVSQKSHDFIENCDLPRPLNRSIKRDPNNLFGKYDYAAKAQKSDEVYSSKVEEQALFGSDKQSSEDHKTSTKILETDPTKVQLMEALCHSQTRAREAEKAAKQANAEKEHILKLFLKQASHLFAYKQWFQLLQLENIYAVDLPFAPNKNRKLPKRPAKAKKRGPEQDFGKLSVAFVLGLVGAGLFLGWTVAWMLPAL